MAFARRWTHTLPIAMAWATASLAAQAAPGLKIVFKVDPAAQAVPAASPTGLVAAALVLGLLGAWALRHRGARALGALLLVAGLAAASLGPGAWTRPAHAQSQWQGQESFAPPTFISAASLATIVVSPSTFSVPPGSGGYTSWEVTVTDMAPTIDLFIHNDGSMPLTLVGFEPFLPPGDPEVSMDVSSAIGGSTLCSAGLRLLSLAECGLAVIFTP